MRDDDNPPIVSEQVDGNNTNNNSRSNSPDSNDDGRQGPSGLELLQAIANKKGEQHYPVRPSENQVSKAEYENIILL